MYNCFEIVTLGIISVIRLEFNKSKDIGRLPLFSWCWKICCWDRYPVYQESSLDTSISPKVFTDTAELPAFKCIQQDELKTVFLLKGDFYAY